MNVVKSSRVNISPKPSTAQPAKVNLYTEIPKIEVSLDDFEEYALDRLKVRRSRLSKQHTRRCGFHSNLCYHSFYARS
jgi:hypothetical protein